MYTTFHINVNELDNNFLKGLKSLFRNKNVSIIVEEEQDETEYLLASEANRKMLEQSLKNVEEGKLIEVDIEKFLKK
jgi:hypothetical protein